jgi:hypothetical protein
VKSQTTIQFRKQFADLPKQTQEQTRKAYRQFKNDPSDPSLRFKKSTLNYLFILLELTKIIE